MFYHLMLFAMLWIHPGPTIYPVIEPDPPPQGSGRSRMVEGWRAPPPVVIDPAIDNDPPPPRGGGIRRMSGKVSI